MLREIDKKRVNVLPGLFRERMQVNQKQPKGIVHHLCGIKSVLPGKIQNQDQYIFVKTAFVM